MPQFCRKGRLSAALFLVVVFPSSDLLGGTSGIHFLEGDLAVFICSRSSLLGKSPFRLMEAAEYSQMNPLGLLKWPVVRQFDDQCSGLLGLVRSLEGPGHPGSYESMGGGGPSEENSAAPRYA
jgi:hypothetical protein